MYILQIHLRQQYKAAKVGNMAGHAMMEKHLFNLKFASKQMVHHAKKCDKEERLDKEKCKKAIKQGNLDCARIHAENAIRKNNQSLNFLRMSARLDGVANKVQNAITMRQVTGSMAGVAKSMDVALQNMNIEQISLLMDKFEQQCETLDVQTSTVESAMGQSCATSMPINEVDRLMAQIAGEAGLELHLELPNAQANTLGGSSYMSQERDALTNRLGDLRKNS